MKKILYLLIPFFLFLTQEKSYAQALHIAQEALVGTQIDSLPSMEYHLNEPADKNFNKKFKVLEFWATWCRPCLKAVPHLNRLQEKFKDSNIVFMSITYEERFKTEQIFRKVNFETIVTSDSTRNIHQKLRIQYNGTMGLPRTVLIDDENRIVWYGFPTDLNEKLLEKFLAKQSLKKSVVPGR